MGLSHRGGDLVVSTGIPVEPSPSTSLVACGGATCVAFVGGDCGIASLSPSEPVITFKPTLITDGSTRSRQPISAIVRKDNRPT